MKRTVSWLTLLVLLVGACFGCSSVGNLSPQELVVQGNQALAEGNPQKALSYFMNLTKIEPQNPEGYVGASKAYLGMSNPMGAKAILEEGLKKVLPADVAAIEQQIVIVDAGGGIGLPAEASPPAVSQEPIITPPAETTPSSAPEAWPSPDMTPPPEPSFDDSPVIPPSTGGIEGTVWRLTSGEALGMEVPFSLVEELMGGEFIMEFGSGGVVMLSMGGLSEQGYYTASGGTISVTDSAGTTMDLTRQGSTMSCTMNDPASGMDITLIFTQQGTGIGL